MAFKEYGNYDAVGLAELVRKKDVTAAELLDEAIARTAKVDPQINAVVVKHYDYAERQIDTGLPDGPFTGVPFLLKDLDPLQGTRTTSAPASKGYCRRPQRHAGAALSRCRRRDLRQELEPGIRPDADHGIAPARADPQSLESRRIPPADRPAARQRRWPRASFPSRMPAMAAARSGFPRPPPACSALKPTRARNPLGPDRGEGWGGFSCGHVVSISVRDSAVDDGRDPRTGAIEPLRRAARRSDRLRRRSAAIPASCASPSPTSRPMATPSIPRLRPRCATIAKLLAGLGHHVEERAPKLAADPAAVMATIVGANTALTVRLAEQRFGRAMTENDFEILTLASAHNARKDQPRPTMSPRQLAAFQISRALADFLRDLRCVPVPDACARRRCGSANSTPCRTTCRISRRSCAATCRAPPCSTCPGQPAMSVPLAWNKAGLPLGMMFSAQVRR